MIYITDRLRAATIENILADSDQIAYSGTTNGHSYRNVKGALDAMQWEEM